MPELAPRYPCPVCLGVQMEKTPVGPKGKQVVLDWCRRCGGIWFEAGEVLRLRGTPPKELWKRVSRLQRERFRMQCHACLAHMHRDQESCPACGWRNRIDCPQCGEAIEPQAHQGLTLDACRRCKGVWFDHHELSAIWTLSLATALERRGAAPGAAVVDGGGYVLEALVYSPDLVFYGAHAAGHVVGASVEVLAAAPEAAAGALGVVGEAAGAVFEVIVSIIGGIFEGIG